jgi:DNA-binding GntR family transcriptional regulator
MRLMAEGLLTAGPNRGLVVTSVSLEEVAALYVVQEALDGIAARLAAERHNADVEMQLEHNLNAMRHACQAKQVDNVVRINREFHALVRTAAANPYVDRFLTEVERRFRRFPPDDVQSRALEAVEEHAAIVEAIKRGDGKAAESAAAHHQRKAKETRIRNLLGYVG